MNATAAALLGFHVRRRTRSLLLVLFAECYESKKGDIHNFDESPLSRSGRRDLNPRPHGPDLSDRS